MKWIDFILGRTSQNAPDFLAGTKGNKSVKVPYIKPGSVLIGSSIGFNLNSTSDQLITLSGGNSFVITDILINNVSTKLTTAADLEFFDQPLRGGNQIGTTINGINDFLTTIFNTIGSISGKYLNKDGSNSLLVNKSNIQVSNNLYASLGTAQGSLATCDIRIYGYILS